MATTQPVRIISQPGIKRDGTAFEGDNYADGVWCRFSRRGLPRKIRGYNAVSSQLPEIVRGMKAYFFGGTNFIHMGSRGFCTQVQATINGQLGSQFDRTPVGFDADDNNLWQFTLFYNTATSETTLVANAGHNLSDPTNSTETPIYYGPASGTGKLVASGMDPVSGGVVAVAPYLIAYSNYGRVDVSKINDLTTAPDSAFVSSQKIVMGLPLRNGAGGPAVLLWSLSDLVMMTYNPNLLAGIPFNFNTVSEDISVLSSQAIVEYNGLYYWPEVDHFSVFNGVVQELPNSLNLDFFFDNLNFEQRQKVFAFKVHSAGEIWWCFPLGDATECNHAIIYNVYLKTWYDTPLPDSGRTAGDAPRAFNRPYMADLDETTTGFTLWQHETGLDKVIGGGTYPIRSSFMTSEMAAIKNQPAKDKALRVALVEPDLKQKGDLTARVYGRANCREDPALLGETTVVATPTAADQELALFKQNARLMAFEFESNTIGGDFYLGHALAHIEETDGRYTK